VRRSLAVSGVVVDRLMRIKCQAHRRAASDHDHVNDGFGAARRGAGIHRGVQRGDALAAASAFATNARFSTPLGSCAPCTGRTRIEQKLAAAITAGTKIEMTQPTVTGNDVSAHSTLTSPKFPPGVTRAIGSFTATVENGEITKLIQEYDRTDPQTALLFKGLGQ
jgi:hypothetical protein